MAKSWNRVETWVTLLVLGAGGVVLALAGLWVYVSATAIPLHPDASSVPSATASSPSAQWAEAVERGRQAMRAGLAEQNLPGVSVAVGVNGAIVWAEGFGWANIESKTAVTPETRFRIGNASIPFTAAAVGLLLERGRLKLDDEIQAYVPEFPRKERPVSLRQLMAHTSGVRNDGGDEGPLYGEHCARPVEALTAFADRDLLFEPGTRHRFSNFGWIVVSAAVEAAAGEPFLTFMQKQVFGPLGMDDTAADTAVAATVPDRSTAYFPRFAADPRYGPDVMREVDYSCYAGAGAFVSTASDLVRFGMATLGGTWLQPATVQQLQEPQQLTSGENTGYGLGWDLEAVTLAGAPVMSIGHNGDLLGGMAVSLRTFREHGLVVAVVANTSYAHTDALALQVADGFATHRDDAERDSRLPAAQSVWVLQPPDRIIEYDVATFAARRTIPVPARVVAHPEYLAVNAHGQLLFAVPAGTALGETPEDSANLVWAWDGSTAREWPRDTGPEAPRQWFLETGGGALLAWETRLHLERDSGGVERSVRTATRLLRTNLSGGDAETVAAIADLPACACETGVCSETCPIWRAWAPQGVVGGFLLATRFVAGQLQPDYQQSVVHQHQGGRWAARELTAPVTAALAASADGRMLAEAVQDSGCCGWINESSDQLAIIRDGRPTVLYDEWARFENRNYDASFPVAAARFDPSGAKLAYTLTADAPGADEEIRLSLDGQANSSELARIRTAAGGMPSLEIVDLADTAAPRVVISGTSLVGWIDADRLLAVSGGRLTVYDRRGQKLRETPIAVRRPADVFLPPR